MESDNKKNLNQDMGPSMEGTKCMQPCDPAKWSRKHDIQGNREDHNTVDIQKVYEAHCEVGIDKCIKGTIAQMTACKERA